MSRGSKVFLAINILDQLYIYRDIFDKFSDTKLSSLGLERQKEKTLLTDLPILFFFLLDLCLLVLSTTLVFERYMFIMKKKKGKARNWQIKKREHHCLRFSMVK